MPENLIRIDVRQPESKMERRLTSGDQFGEGGMSLLLDATDANLMRKLTDMTGLKLGDKMEDALSRMEAGEDPDAIEQELGDIDESDLFSVASSGKGGGKRQPPTRDETLYEM